MSSWISNVYMDTVMKEVKMGIRRIGVSVMEEVRECRPPGLLYVDDLVLWGESEEDLKPMVGRLGKVRRRRGLKVNADKSNVIVLN